MKIVTAGEMREIDRLTSQRFGVASLTLMENAGTAVAQFVASQYPSGKRIGVICGKGNNGGDGFVAARKLQQAGKEVRVLLLAERPNCGATLRKCLPNCRWRRSSRYPSISCRQPARYSTWMFWSMPILGTGFQAPVSELYAAAIATLNASSVPVVAVDIPSGADADVMGEQVGSVAQADASSLLPRLVRLTFLEGSLPDQPSFRPSARPTKPSSPLYSST